MDETYKALGIRSTLRALDGPQESVRRFLCIGSVPPFYYVHGDQSMQPAAKSTCMEIYYN